MGSWGPGAFESDHAMDLLSLETTRWVGGLSEVLDAPTASWDDIEGLLVYVHLLAFAGQQATQFGMLVTPARASAGPPESSRAVARRWRARFLALDADTPRTPELAAARREVVEHAFDALVAVAPDDDAPRAKPARVRAVRPRRR